MATIIVKTPAEFRDAHVTIEIRADQDEVQSAANVLDQAERAGKVPALETQVKELKAQLETATLMAREFNVDRETERQRADENRRWAERTEALLENVTTERDALRLQIENSILTPIQLGGPLGQARAKLTRIQDKVWRDTLDFAMNHRGDPASIPVETVGDLAAAVSAVRSIVGQP